jgi:glycosyltransferase involved in cell wall biosynthesis
MAGVARTAGLTIGAPVRTTLEPPMIVQPDAPGHPFRPTWHSAAEFLGDEHRRIHELTADLPGWQDPADSQKLYEMGFRRGEVMLEIGVFGGRSAAVQIMGALAGARRFARSLPQFFGLDVDRAAIGRARATLRRLGLARHALLYHGDLEAFLRDLPIAPTMVFVDGDHTYGGVWADLHLLRRVLAPGTPVLCHDYAGIEGVRRAVDDAVRRTGYAPLGRFAGSILLRAPGPGRTAGRIAPECFERTRRALLARYEEGGEGRHTRAGDVTAGARRELRAAVLVRPGINGRGAWPRVAPDEPPLPGSMPGGAPWPRISIITPSLNQGEFIEEAILSVIHQGYPDVEHIVIDGGSRDATPGVLARYADRLAGCVREPDAGQSHAINKGFARATGSILTWLNSDDMLAPGALPAAALAFAQSGADLVAGELHVVRDGEPAHAHLTSCPPGLLPLDDLLDIDGCWQAGQFFFQPEVLFTRAILDRAGGRVSTSAHFGMDYDLWLRMAGAGARLHVIGRPVAFFRAHAAQKTADRVGFTRELPLLRARFLASRPARSLAPPRGGGTDRLRIVLLNDLGYAYGAGIAHRRLATMFARAGHEVRALALGAAAPVRESQRVTSAELVDAVGASRPDLVVAGNLHGSEAPLPALAEVCARFETALVMHDLWLLTGRCPYPGACARYLAGCDARCTCPAAYPDEPADGRRRAWLAKRRLISGGRTPLLLTNSRWLLSRLRQTLAAPGALPDGAPPPRSDWIRFGFELGVFRPRGRNACRDMLGLPRDRFVILTAAASLEDRRKGVPLLAEALRLLGLRDVLVVGVGYVRPGAAPPISGMRIVGHVDRPARLAALFSAADLFVAPSTEEALGQVFVEAAACGTPSIGFDVGGVPEALSHGVSGLLAERIDAPALAHAIETLFADPALREDMGRWARLWVENEWSFSAAWSRFAAVLRESGVGDRIGLARKTSLVPGAGPPRVERIAAAPPEWRAIEGFGPCLGAGAPPGLARARWAQGPIARFEIHAERGGRARLLMSCRNTHRDQRVRLLSAGREAGERDVPASPGADVLLDFRVALRPGWNALAIVPWRWGPPPARQAILVSSIVLDAPLR